MKVFTIDPGRFDPLTAYAAVNTLRLDDMNPHIYRTHDGGKSWKEIVAGIPGGAPVSVVREDPKRKGLLFAGSETQVYVSFDDGDHWQSLRLNMAASSVRDLVIKDDDLVVGTHGRGIWILDDITPLRQIDASTAQQDVVLFKPQTAWRVRWNTNTDTPLPPDEPAAPNPPEGAIINYYLKSAATGPVTLEVLGAGGQVLRDLSQHRRGLHAGSRDRHDPAVLVSSGAHARDHAGDASLHVGRALSAGRRRQSGRRADAADCGDRPQHGAGAHDAVGQSGHLHRQAHGRTASRTRSRSSSARIPGSRRRRWRWRRCTSCRRPRTMKRWRRRRPSGRGRTCAPRS